MKNRRDGDGDVSVDGGDDGYHDMHVVVPPLAAGLLPMAITS